VFGGKVFFAGEGEGEGEGRTALTGGGTLFAFCGTEVDFCDTELEAAGGTLVTCGFLGEVKLPEPETGTR
jgi:hypothetical protein